MKYAFALILAGLLFVNSPKTSYAQQYGQGTYGQGTVLGKGEEVVIEHETVDAGLKEDLGTAGIGLLFASLISLYLYKKEAKELI